MGGDDSGDQAATFEALLEPHRAQLEAVARAREERRAAATAGVARPPRRLDEGELMALIFAHLDDNNPRVCAGIDFERLVIVESSPAEGPGEGGEGGEGEEGDSALERGPVEELPTPGAPRLAASEWIGASWSDDLGPEVELVEQPQLSAAEHALIAGAAQQPGALSQLDLHALDRHQALRHLELFVDLCRARGERYCRVITGKGVSSSGAPVLKRVVLEWLVAGPPRPSGGARVLASAPELDRYGEWGALILRLRRLRPPVTL